MRIILNNASMVPIYEQLMDQIKNEILSGGLKENEVLPSVRALSGELEEEGFVVTVHGKGTYVAAADRQLALEARRKTVEDAFAAAVQKARAVGFTREEILAILEIILEDY